MIDTNKTALAAVLKRLGLTTNTVALAKFLIGNSRSVNHYFWMTTKTLPFKPRDRNLSDIVSILIAANLVTRAGTEGAERWRLYPTAKLLKYTSTDDRVDYLKEQVSSHEAEIAALKADMLAVREAIADIQANDPPVTQSKIDDRLLNRKI